MGEAFGPAGVKPKIRITEVDLNVQDARSRDAGTWVD
jgi:hypothetical protein